MFTLLDSVLDRHCQGYSRREFLKVGSLSLGGLTLGGLLAARADAAAGQVATGKSVVLLFLQGGPSHIEFFDPKMTAPEEIRSVTGEIPTKLPGITFGGTFAKLAAMADKLTVVRSFGSNNTDHQNYLSVAGGGSPLKASMGSMYSRVVGSTNRQTGIPSNTIVVPEAVSPGLKLGSNFETKALPGLLSPGSLGASYAAFDPSGGSELKQNLELKIPRERFDDRRNLLIRLDELKRQMETTRTLDGLDAFQQQAYEVIIRGVAEAFDLSQEDPRIVERYDTSQLFDMADLNKFGDMRRSSNLLGKQMLMARRLCEAGCGFVTVADAGWDMHANGNSPKEMAGIVPLGHQVDHAVAAFLDDVRERGLSDKILLVVTGEMGRTPRINKNGGRDHYGNLTPLLLAGGGLQMGQVIGQSDGQAGKPATEPYSPAHLLSTVMHTLFDIGQLRLVSGLPQELLKVVTESQPIKGLL
jgi:uncharacterized protein (DUF1501 family)